MDCTRSDMPNIRHRKTPEKKIAGIDPPRELSQEKAPKGIQQNGRGVSRENPVST
jgi:hypothetical protein